MMPSSLRAMPLLAATILSMVVSSSSSSSSSSDIPPQQPQTTVFSDQADFGVDCSFPIHNLDFNKTARCGNLLGDRASLYQEFIEGCRAKFGKRCDVTEEDRVTQMLRQAPSMVNYTETGYQKIKAPPKLYNLILQHWKRNQDNHADHVAEEWTKGFTYVNYWAQNTTYYGIMDPKVGGSQQLMDQVFDLAKPVIEEWTGMELAPTSLYGIRVYHQGAILSPHVDRNPLISSAIINVAQDPDMEGDWPLEVYGRDGKALNITMEPGDMVLYESGSLIHARPFPLQGKYYANIFIHFEPTGRTLADINDEESFYPSLQHPGNYEDGVLLPPYIVPGSPEAKHYAGYNPYGWDGYGTSDELDDDSDSDDDEEELDDDDEDWDENGDWGEENEDEEYDDEDEEDEDWDEEDEDWDEDEEDWDEDEADWDEEDEDWGEEESDFDDYDEEDYGDEEDNEDIDNVDEPAAVFDRNALSNMNPSPPDSDPYPTCPTNFDAATSPSQCLQELETLALQ